MNPINFLVLFFCLMYVGGEPEVQMTFMEESLLKTAVLAVGCIFVFRVSIKLQLLK